MRIVRLNEGITHIEDLSIDKFIDTVKNIFNFHVSEKIDGANLWFGLDNSDIFYTTREQKSGDKDRKYHSKDYSKVAAYNGFRSAHDALESFLKLGKYRGALHPGDKIEIEVVFGKQPNVVKYSEDGTNFIVLLRPVDGTSDKHFDELVKKLDGKEVTVQSDIIDTTDGQNLITTRSPFKWKIVKNVSEKVSSSLISHKSVLKILAQLEEYLKQKHESVSKASGSVKTNFDVLTMKLVGLPTAAKEVVKVEREKVSQQVLTQFKLPIKRQIFDDLIENGSFLSNSLKKEKTDLEGFVLSNGEQQIKIVDRDLFTAINEFNFKIRNELNGAVMSDDIDAPLINKGGVFGNCKLRIANLFDVTDLAKSAKAKKLFAKYKGATPAETISNFVKSLKINDFGMYQNKILAILTDTQNDLNERLDTFKQESKDYKVELKNGTTIPYSEESVKRTLLAFAELNKELTKLRTLTKKAGNVNNLIAALYGKFVEDVHNKKVEEATTKTGAIMTEQFSLLKTVTSLTEDGEGAAVDAGGSAPDVAAPATGATTAGAIATLPIKMFNGKVIKRVKRNYFPKKKKSHK